MIFFKCSHKDLFVDETHNYCSQQIILILCQSLQIYLYDCTEVSPYSLLFFGGDISIQKDQGQDTIAVDEWIVFQSPGRIAHLVKVMLLQ